MQANLVRGLSTASGSGSFWFRSRYCSSSCSAFAGFRLTSGISATSLISSCSLRSSGWGSGILAARARHRSAFRRSRSSCCCSPRWSRLNRFELNISSTDVLYFGSGTHGIARAESFILLPLIFTFVAAGVYSARPDARIALHPDGSAHRLATFLRDTLLSSLAAFQAFFCYRLLRSSADLLVCSPRPVGSGPKRKGEVDSALLC